jgi:hypothetical protein
MFKYWLYTFWMDFQNSKAVQQQYVILQQEFEEEERKSK